jgi:hypothetical protein
LRALFEYNYTAKGLRMWPHLPPGITRLIQKIPASFGQTRIFVGTTGQGKPVKALVNGKSLPMEPDGSLFLQLDGAKKNVTVEFLLGDAKPEGVPVILSKTIIPPVNDTKFWDLASRLDTTNNPPNFAAAGVFLKLMERAQLGDSFEAGQARVVIQILTALHERRRLNSLGILHTPLLDEIPAAQPEEVEKCYARQARFILGGLHDHLTGRSLQRYPVSPKVYQLAIEAGLI